MASKILVNEITHTDSTSNVVISKISSADTVITNTIKLAEIPNSTRDALTATNGMMIYNSTSNEIQIYVNGSWVKVTTGAVTS
jgi:hypothetical protein|tara:strand:+ start:243 stop:491 length:249 start_codon:yes stop_codon:yes gene_type:complete